MIEFDPTRAGDPAVDQRGGLSLREIGMRGGLAVVALGATLTPGLAMASEPSRPVLPPATQLEHAERGDSPAEPAKEQFGPLVVVPVVVVAETGGGAAAASATVALGAGAVVAGHKAGDYIVDGLRVMFRDSSSTTTENPFDFKGIVKSRYHGPKYEPPRDRKTIAKLAAAGVVVSGLSIKHNGRTADEVKVDAKQQPCPNCENKPNTGKKDNKAFVHVRIIEAPTRSAHGRPALAGGVTDYECSGFIRKGIGVLADTRAGKAVGTASNPFNCSRVFTSRLKIPFTTDGTK